MTLAAPAKDKSMSSNRHITKYLFINLKYGCAK